MANPLTIFLAEDSSADAYLVQESLQGAHLNFELVRASDGESALQALMKAEQEGTELDVILLDLNLPRVSGHELLAYVRQSDHLHNIPVIVLTSSDSPDDRSRSYALGVNHYFRKPSEFGEFLQLGGIVEKICAPSS